MSILLKTVNKGRPEEIRIYETILYHAVFQLPPLEFTGETDRYDTPEDAISAAKQQREMKLKEKNPGYLNEIAQDERAGNLEESRADQLERELEKDEIKAEAEAEIAAAVPDMFCPRCGGPGEYENELCEDCEIEL